MSRLQDLICILRALQTVGEASVKLQGENFKLIWQNSSLRVLPEELMKQSQNVSKKSPNVADLINTATDSSSRIWAVIHGLKVYTSHTLSKEHSIQRYSTVHKFDDTVNQSSDEPNLLEKSINNTTKEKVSKAASLNSVLDIKLTASDKELLKKLDMEHREKIHKQKEKEVKHEDVEEAKTIKAEKGHVTAVPNQKSKQALSTNAKQRKVPSSRIGRMVSFGTLVAGLGLGTAAEFAKRTVGLSEPTHDGLLMTKANLDRIVDTLCKVRGAALKLGQILSIQDESIVKPELARALERVRKSADYMPNWQVEQVMNNELGPNWRDHFIEFEERPFAAASIGQVHAAKLLNGRDVAIKIQYPGVAKGIESDINNLGAIMNHWNVFPKGMFLDNLMIVAKRELAWEVDYVREAECTRRFKEILQPYNDYYVPTVIDELSTKQVFTTELLDGDPVDQCFDLDVHHREFIAQKVMELCLLEIFEFRYMQTDPNWANFLYNPSKKQLLLLDFGASRSYSKEFIDKYVRILKAACDCDRETVLNISRELGFLTGYESKIMEEAHVDAVMILGEVFRHIGKYNFANQDMIVRIQKLAETMLAHRLCPPPEEVYSLHRKLSGVFLLCTKLNVSISCRDTFLTLYEKYTSKSI